MEYARETKNKSKDFAVLQQHEYVRHPNTKFEEVVGPCLGRMCKEIQHRKILDRYLVHFRLFLFIVRSANYASLRELVSDDHDFHVLTEYMVNEKMIRRVIIPRKGKRPAELFQFLEINHPKDLTYLLATQLFSYIDKKKFDKTWIPKGENVPHWNQIMSAWKGETGATEEDQNIMKKIIKYWAEYYKTSLNWNMKEWHEEQDLYKRALGLSH